MASPKKRKWYEDRNDQASQLVERADTWRYVADRLAESLYLITEEPSAHNKAKADDAIQLYEEERRG